MTKTELADLELAIGLIGDLRKEMQSSFTNLTTSLEKVSEAQVSHQAVHEDREKAAATSGVSKRWVVQVVVASTLTILFGLGGLIIAAVKAFG